MNIQIKTTGISLTPAIEEYVYKKFEAVKKFLKDAPLDLYCYVDVGKTTNHHKSGEFFRADVSMEFQGKRLYAESEKEDLYSAIDDVKDDLVRTLTTTKSKRLTTDRKKAGSVKNAVKGL